jgi:aminopeptidase N
MKFAMTSWLITASVTLAGPVLAEAPFSFDTAPGRLPKSVVPIDYDIHITPDIQGMKFQGSESVALQFRAATATIQLNILDETLTDVRLDGQSVKSVQADNDKQLATITLAQPAPVGKHTLSLSYSGPIQQRPQGLFLQPYTKADGSNGAMLSTQFEATDARRLFPGWDEPAFRATYQLTFTVPAAWATVSNMPIAKRVEQGQLATTTFERSPRMPAYLVDFNAGDLKELSGKSGATGVGVWALSGHEAEGATALANAQQILADYNDYFGYAFPLPKLDSIAIPGGFSGAMENWGAITYKDQALLVSKASSLADRQEVYATQAHEMAHQWNGDLVTMGWWDELWLNESFASWQAARETDLRNPTWKWWESRDEDKESAMAADARLSARAIQAHVTDELQASNAFDPVITYNKGQSVLRMLEAYLGPDTFRDGVRRYMKARAFGNATSADLWNALTAASGQDVGALAAGWTDQPGFPLVSVSAQCDTQGNRTISLSQQRFLEHATAGGSATPATHWRVPLVIRSGVGSATHSVLLTSDKQTAPAGHCQEPLTVDAGAMGYFRVQYDATTLTTNTKSFESLPDGDRIALLDDQWALVESGAAPLASYLGLAQAMGKNINARAWTQIARALGTLEYDERGTPGHDAFAAYARSIVRPLFDRLGWDGKPGELPTIQSLRRSVIEELGAWGEPAVIVEAQRRFGLFLHDRKAIAPDDQEMTLSIVGSYADAATYDQLHGLIKQTKDLAELRRFYLALCNARDPKLAASAAQLAMSSEIPAQETQLRLLMIRTLRNRNPQLAWTTFSANEPKLLSSYGNLEPLIVAQYVPEMFWNSVPLEQLQAWILARVPKEMAAEVNKGMDGAKFRADVKRVLVPAADAYVKAGKSPA